MAARIKVDGTYWKFLEFRVPSEGEYYFNPHGSVVQSQGRGAYPHHIVRQYTPERYYINGTTVYDRQDIYFYLPFDYYEDALRATERLNNVHCK